MNRKSNETRESARPALNVAHSKNVKVFPVNGSRNRIGHRVTVNLFIVGTPPEGLESIIRAAVAAAFRPRP